MNHVLGWTESSRGLFEFPEKEPSNPRINLEVGESHPLSMEHLPAKFHEVWTRGCRLR